MPKPKKTIAAKPAAQTTLVTFLLDETSSMGGRKAQTLSGFNEYLTTLKADPNPCEMTLLTFSSGSKHGDKIRKKYVATPLADVPALTADSYDPDGMTPLVEAAIVTINATAAALAQRDDNPRVIMVIQTDGEENSSGTEYSWPALSALRAEKEAAGWQFVFIGAAMDAYQQAARMGVSAANTMSYGDNIGQTRAAFASTASNMNAVRSGLSATVAYSSVQKSAAGDMFDPAIATRPAVKPPALGAPYVNYGGPAPDLSKTLRPDQAKSILGKFRAAGGALGGLDLSKPGAPAPSKPAPLDLTKG